MENVVFTFLSFEDKKVLQNKSKIMIEQPLNITLVQERENDGLN